MIEPMRLVEFAFVLDKESEQPFVGLIDAKDISRIVQVDGKHCNIVLKDGEGKMSCGNLRTLTNRWIYALEKKFDHYQDDIIRPSVMIYHRPETMGIDAGYFDHYQLLQFVKALRPELLNNALYKEILEL